MTRTNMKHIIIHMERARVHGFMRKAKFIPSGIADNRYVGGGVNCCTMIKHIFYESGFC